MSSKATGYPPPPGKWPAENRYVDPESLREEAVTALRAMKARESFEPRYLGRQVGDGQVFTLDRIPWAPSRLDEDGSMLVTLHCTEFSSICPVTKMPDYGRLEIAYQPGEWLVETKSLKLWLQAFRNRPQFNEALVKEIGYRFAQYIEPRYLVVRGVFNHRGGISVEAQWEYLSPGGSHGSWRLGKATGR